MGVDFRELLVILIIVLIVFGTKRLRNLGSDLGSAIKSFRKSMNEPEEEVAENKSSTIDGEVVEKKDKT